MRWENEMKVSGGCLCGKVTYKADGEPIFQALCYCRDCQKSTGASHFGGVGFAASNVDIDGKVKRFLKKGDSGSENARLFCPKCGTTVAAEAAGGQVLILAAGTLDDLSAFEPQLAVYTRSRPRWGQVALTLTEFEAAPPMGG
jgi:hypothetical protein